MLELFTKLIEKLIDLAKERQRSNKSIHDHFVAPLMTLFDEVHNQYIASFQKYREQVLEQSPDFDADNSVFKQLESDMIFSHSAREKMFAMTEGLRPFRDTYHWADEDPVGRLIMELFEYISDISDSAGNRYRNAPRGTLLSELHEIATNPREHAGMTPSQLAEREIMQKLWEMQDWYGRIQLSYQKAKSQLIK